MENTTGNRPFKLRNSHSNFRHGISDYNDGENVTHQLGNDDYHDGANLPEYPDKDSEAFDGKTARGNDLLEEDEAQDANLEIGFDEGIDYE